MPTMFAESSLLALFSYPFILDERGIGVWQLAARYSLTNLNSNVSSGVSQSLTGGVFGGSQKIFGAALSWYQND
jgi:phosphate-selective porin